MAFIRVVSKSKNEKQRDVLLNIAADLGCEEGQVSVKAAFAFLVLQALIGLVVLLQFNGFAIGVGLASLAVVAIYPFMKRVTYWPHLFLGLAFSWGALMGWAAFATY